MRMLGPGGLGALIGVGMRSIILPCERRRHARESRAGRRQKPQNHENGTHRISFKP